MNVVDSKKYFSTLSIHSHMRLSKVTKMQPLIKNILKKTVMLEPKLWHDSICSATPGSKNRASNKLCALPRYIFLRCLKNANRSSMSLFLWKLYLLVFMCLLPLYFLPGVFPSHFRGGRGSHQRLRFSHQRGSKRSKQSQHLG